jgi:hypothetical protein
MTNGVEKNGRVVSDLCDVRHGAPRRFALGGWVGSGPQTDSGGLRPVRLERGSMKVTMSEGQIGHFVGGEYDLIENDVLPSPEEGRRLMLAFMNIRRPALREAIINTVTTLSGSYRDGGATFSAEH